MKKLILAGIVIIICCLVFLIVRQNSSRADISVVYVKPYPVPFGDWVRVYLSTIYAETVPGYYSLGEVTPIPIEGKIRFRISVLYTNTEMGKLWYQEKFPIIKKQIGSRCEAWAAEGYPISLNDFEFDIRAF